MSEFIFSPFGSVRRRKTAFFKQLKTAWHKNDVRTLLIYKLYFIYKKKKASVECLPGPGKNEEEEMETSGIDKAALHIHLHGLKVFEG